MPTLVLWDIDHTLIETNGVGAQVYRAAFEAVTGVAMRHHADATGATEPTLFNQNLELNGVTATRGLFQRFAVEQARQYTARIDDLRRIGRALPGAAAALALFTGLDVVQTVVTGNTRDSALIKLEAFGLARHLDLGIGAFGTDADDRADLLALACQHAGRQPDDAMFIGDTTADMEAGLRAGVSTIGVATGKATLGQLATAGATKVLTDLTELDAL
jgi:phosphoglycolate phosphatase